MYLAHSAGIRVFSTGGVGGVHRGADQTFDISADLQELSQTPVCVVCAGVKSILDIGKTLEYLETHSVNCIVYSDKNVFPGFFTAETQYKGQLNTENLEEVAKIIESSSDLGLHAGTILACPIPNELQVDGDFIEKIIKDALEESKAKRIISQQVTPFILKRVNELSEGKSMKTNIELLKNNAKIASKLAKLLVGPRFHAAKQSEANGNDKRRPKVTVIGATILDYEAVTNEHVQNDGGSYAGKMEQRCGGVARNHADALTRLGCDVTLLSAIGNDALGEWIRKRCNHMNWDNVVVSNKFSTATYLSINVQGNINFGINSIGNVIYDISPEYIKKHEQSIAEADFVLIDGNISEEAIKQIAITSKYYNKKIWFEPTDYHKVNKIMDDDVLPQISIMSPNANEFMHFAQKCDVSVNPAIFTSPYHIGEFVLSNLKLLHSFDYLIVSLAQNGTAIIRKADDESYSFIGLPPPIQPDLIVSASGAGDSFNSGFLAAMLNGVPFDASPIVGQKCASLTLQTIEAVSTQITPKLISEIRSYSKNSPT
ncbi:hypothetical protein WR25_23929 isoform C [Diploscapter pachys]|nr:hypothetical protein WR25_23929 isoform B [Diploscapter pachys]PAV58387.1 hypothetical protein WR25_23929 isoform C [Diploscapter pachys]